MQDNSAAAALPWWTPYWFPWLSLAPQSLFQPINPGWSFGNVIVNEENSSAPDTERAIVAQQSYGRQLGKLLDAVAELIQEQGGAGKNEAFQELIDLKDKIDRIKEEGVAKRIAQLGRDLDFLARTNEAAFARNVEALRALLPKQAAKGRALKPR